MTIRLRVNIQVVKEGVLLGLYRIISRYVKQDGISCRFAMEWEEINCVACRIMANEHPTSEDNSIHSFEAFLRMDLCLFRITYRPYKVGTFKGFVFRM